MKKLIEINEQSNLNFGDYTLSEKSKENIIYNEYEYKLKTFKDVTRLERDELLIYESVPGTYVENFSYKSDEISFMVSGNDTASIIIGVNQDSNFSLTIDDKFYPETVCISPGKLNINLNFNKENKVKVVLTKIN